MAYQSFQQQYNAIPPITRTYVTASVLTTLAVQLDIVSPLQLYFNHSLIIWKLQFWRAITTFLFFGTFGFNFLFNMIFIYRYTRMLEETFYRRRIADFVTMFLFGGTVMVLCGCFFRIVFLSQALTMMVVYVWSRRAPLVQLNIFGLFNFRAPYLPWVHLGLSLLLGNSMAAEILGIATGHLYYFLEDVFPSMQGGFKVIVTPNILKALLDPVEQVYRVNPADRPGGYHWGQRPNPPQNQVPGAGADQPQPVEN